MRGGGGKGGGGGGAEIPVYHKTGSSNAPSRISFWADHIWGIFCLGEAGWVGIKFVSRGRGGKG